MSPLIPKSLLSGNSRTPTADDIPDINGQRSTTGILSSFFSSPFETLVGSFRSDGSEYDDIDK
jgi:hypothetical protein